ncbi:MAG: acyloxyacyl hydrolase [Burkholderiales bacterium]|nr:acyloxyacyl hydrolase [Burkholderiales bacterium]
MSPTLPRLLALGCVALFLSAPAAAQRLTVPKGFFVEGGGGGDRTWNTTVGLAWPWGWKYSLAGSEITGITELYLSEWSAPSAGSRHYFTQLGLVPVFRLRMDQGRSPWFFEAGIGLSVMDRKYSSDQKHFSTNFNFIDAVGFGRSFGVNGKQELGLRLQHVSNAGISKPNPGQNFLQLRYSRMF